MRFKNDNQRKAVFSKYNKTYKTISVNSPNFVKLSSVLGEYKGKIYIIKKISKNKKVKLMKSPIKIQVKRKNEIQKR